MNTEKTVRNIELFSFIGVEVDFHYDTCPGCGWTGVLLGAGQCESCQELEDERLYFNLGRGEE